MPKKRPWSLLNGLLLRRLFYIDVLKIQQVGELCEAVDNLFYIVLRKSFEAVHNLLLDGGWGIFRHFPAGIREFDRNDPSIR